MSKVLSRRAAVTAAVAALLGTGLFAPAATAELGRCAWVAEPVTAPAGWDPQHVSVTGSDGRGGYSGFYGPTSAEVTLLRWVNGVPVKQAPAPEVPWTISVDENSSGTVLINGRNFTTNEHSVLTQSRNGTYRRLPIPAGLSYTNAGAINNRGDVVASAYRTGAEGGVLLLWEAHATGAGPRVIEVPGVTVPTAVDLDDDGTILISGGYGVFTWRNGTVKQLPEPTGVVFARSISAGRVVGLTAADPLKSFLWDTRTGKVTYPERGQTAEGVNRRGLVGGEQTGGKAAVWQGGKFLAELPTLNGLAGRVRFVAANGVVFGETYEPGGVPLRWSCR